MGCKYLHGQENSIYDFIHIFNAMKYLKLCGKKMTDTSSEDMTTAIHCTIFSQTGNYKNQKRQNLLNQQNELQF